MANTVVPASVAPPGMAPSSPTPSAQIGSPGNGAVYTRGQVVRASYACQDGTGGPGIASCMGPVPSGQPIDTATIGRHSFTVTAVSSDRQRSSSTVSYTVALPSNRFAVSRVRTHHRGAVTFRVKVPARGTIDVLETAWVSNLARAAVVLQPATHRFVFARAHRTSHRASTLRFRVIPNTRGKRLVRHHTYRVVLRLWISYTPSGGEQRKRGFYGLHLP